MGGDAAEGAIRIIEMTAKLAWIWAELARMKRPLFTQNIVLF